MELKTVVLSLGGSIIVPEELDTSFLSRFKKLVLGVPDKRFIIICGGGRICRKYQAAAKRIMEISKIDLDWIGIMATRLNAEVVRAIFSNEAHDRVINDPQEMIDMSKRIVVGAGFEPGCSTDLRAVQLAERFGSRTVINMSNIDYVYSADPKENPNARKLAEISWREFRDLVGDEWDPGLNMPFDPIASKKAESLGMTVIIVGNSIDNLANLLNGEDYEGTTISGS